jgi:hypothetical protein
MVKFPETELMEPGVVRTRVNPPPCSVRDIDQVYEPSLGIEAASVMSEFCARRRIRVTVPSVEGWGLLITVWIRAGMEGGPYGPSDCHVCSCLHHAAGKRVCKHVLPSLPHHGHRKQCHHNYHAELP